MTSTASLISCVRCGRMPSFCDCELRDKITILRAERDEFKNRLDQALFAIGWYKSKVGYNNCEPQYVKDAVRKATEGK